ncbi:UNVERIFIED_CONTAM: hypothetical protein Slati_0856300 [Sesamum latifolium]|uniref:Uncharacterized protein n=1 Tax=Sesamum latifolium TaxID=2727402 RepID=A0AAW2XSA6_9LAMI
MIENVPEYMENAELAAKMCHNGASPVVHIVELGESFACICSSGRSSTRAQSYASRKIRRPSYRSPLAHKRLMRAYLSGCDHTSTNVPDPIRTPKLSALGRE